MESHSTSEVLNIQSINQFYLVTLIETKHKPTTNGQTKYRGPGGRA